MNSHPIICGTDFSENATQAARAAAAIAARLDRPLLLAHVAEQYSSRFTDEEEQRFCTPLREKLRATADQVVVNGTRAIEQVVLTSGWAEDALVELAKERHASLVVVSSVSKTTFDHWTIGSVSERIAERSPAPTLVARVAEPLIAWAAGERPLRILLAADFSASADAALFWTEQLRKIGPCEITAGHVFFPPEEAERLGFAHTTSLTEIPAGLQEAVEQKLREHIVAHLGRSDMPVVVQANFGRPDAPLIELAKKVQADLLVVGTHQRHGLRRVWQTSTSRGVLHHAPMSVAVVPATAESRHVGVIPRVQRVLVSTDFSPVADRAIPHAYAALPQGGTVRLLHVAPPNESTAAAEQRLRNLIPSGAEARRVQTEVSVATSDDAADTIARQAEQFGADIVCIASHGRSGIFEKLFGSVAHEVIRRSTRPVLVVRARED